MAEVAELEWTVAHISDEADRPRHSIAPSLGYVRTDAFDQVERLIARLLRESGALLDLQAALIVGDPFRCCNTRNGPPFLYLAALMPLQRKLP